MEIGLNLPLFTTIWSISNLHTITSQLLYRLSYFGEVVIGYHICHKIASDFTYFLKFLLKINKILVKTAFSQFLPHSTKNNRTQRVPNSQTHCKNIYINEKTALLRTA